MYEGDLDLLNLWDRRTKGNIGAQYTHIVFTLQTTSPILHLVFILLIMALDWQMFWIRAFIGWMVDGWELQPSVSRARDAVDIRVQSTTAMQFAVSEIKEYTSEKASGYER